MANRPGPIVIVGPGADGEDVDDERSEVPNMPGPIIRTEGLTKRYGHARGIDDLDLEVRPREVFGFLGPNGAGKTTTIQTLLDSIRPTSGRGSCSASTRGTTAWRSGAGSATPRAS